MLGPVLGFAAVCGGKAITDPPVADRLSAREATTLTIAAHRCPYRSQDAACGCSGIRCSLRPAAQQVGSLQQCLDCIRTYGEP